MSDISTITIISKNSGKIENLKAIFFLLPITPTEMINEEPVVPKLPGSIVSVRIKIGTFVGSRGIILKKNKDPLRNSISVLISIGDRFVSAKISVKNVQISGVKKNEEGVLVSNLIIKHLNRIKDALTRMKNYPEKLLETKKWLVDNTIGEIVEERILEEKTDFYTIYDIKKRIKLKRVTFLPQNIDNRILLFFISLSSDYEDYDQFISFVTKFDSNMDFIACEGDKIDLLETNEVMVKKTFSLGFPVNRFVLATKFRELKKFTTTYDNRVDPKVTISLPSKIVSTKTKKMKMKMNTFIVYRTGSVFQSSPTINELISSQRTFLQEINSFKKEITSVL